MFGIEKGKKLYDLTKEACSKSIELFTDYASADTIEKEVLPLLFVASDLACINSNKNRSSISKVLMKQMEKISPNLDLHQFQSRLDFYGEIIRGRRAIRGEWMMGNEPSDNGLIRCVQAFGDFMFNSECIENYDGAPFHNDDISKTFQFATSSIKEMALLVVDYYNQIYVLKL